MAGTSLQVFVFPLKDVVLFPSATIPLNIFEPRYLKMVRDSLSKKTPIAMIRSASSPDQYTHQIAGIGEPMVYQERTDGTMAIFLKGIGKVQLKSMNVETPYMIWNAESVVSLDELHFKNRFRLNRLSRLISKWAEKFIEKTSDRDLFLGSLVSPASVIEIAGSLFVAESDRRQRLLEKDDVNEQLDLLLEWVEPYEKSSDDFSLESPVVHVS